MSDPWETGVSFARPGLQRGGLARTTPPASSSQPYGGNLHEERHRFHTLQVAEEHREPFGLHRESQEIVAVNGLESSPSLPRLISNRIAPTTTTRSTSSEVIKFSQLEEIENVEIATALEAQLGGRKSNSDRSDDKLNGTLPREPTPLSFFPTDSQMEDFTCCSGASSPHRGLVTSELTSHRTARDVFGASLATVPAENESRFVQVVEVGLPCQRDDDRPPFHEIVKLMKVNMQVHQFSQPITVPDDGPKTAAKVLCAAIFLLVFIAGCTLVVLAVEDYI